MERDERGREVRRRPPPGHREPVLDEDAWPVLQHSPYTFEGRIEQAAVMARGMGRRRRLTKRTLGLIVAIAMLAPIVIGAIDLTWGALFD